jgi:hypothetical protein
MMLCDLLIMLVLLLLLINCLCISITYSHMNFQMFYDMSNMISPYRDMPFFLNNVLQAPFWLFYR